ncbi:MAG: sulfatase [Armatimonadetes bacterium]|nr:sulfatase [Armatimonadota bacterium]
MILLVVLVGGLAQAQERPNFIIIFLDDVGYGDLSSYGQTNYQTPHLDRLAAEGTRFTDFLVASPACSPSRAALLTGCYPQRVSVPGVLGPASKTGLHPDEITIADILKGQGYATAIVGKWHLGVTPPLLPLNQGFDEYFGLPYSNDMWPGLGKDWPPLMLYRGNEPVEEVKTLADQDQLTRRYTEFAVDFIKRKKDEPFFLYFPHSMGHVPLGVSEPFKGSSGHNYYADAMVEVDWSVGQIMKTLREEGLDRNTLVLFTSDNGPWLPFGDHAGVSGPLREGKGTTFEGGMREPFIAWWPGRVPAGRVSDTFVNAMDFLPTIARLAGTTEPQDRIIDGRDIAPVLFGETEVSPHRYFFYYWPRQLQAVRAGDWKLHLPHSHRHQEGTPGTGGKSAGQVQRQIGLSLYNLRRDVGETVNLADEYPEVVARLLKLAELARPDLGDSLTDRTGENVRPAGKISGSAQP